MFWRTLLIVGCAFLCGVTSAQTPVLIPRGILWDKLISAVQSVTSDSIIGLYSDTNSPGINESGARINVTFTYNGNLIKATTSGGPVAVLLSYGVAAGVYSDLQALCYFAGNCFAGYTELPSTDPNLRIVKLSDSHGSTTVNYRFSEVANPTRFNLTSTTFLSGTTRGLVRAIGTPMTAPGCNPTSSQGTIGPFDTMQEAQKAYSRSLSAIVGIFGGAAPGCVNFAKFISAMGGLPTALVSSSSAAKADGANPLSYWTVAGVEVLDDSLPPPDQDSDGDGIPDADDPTPRGEPDADNDGIPDRYDRTPNGEAEPNQWDVAPGDEQTKCSIVNIPCNLRQLFVPQVDWNAEWQEMTEVMGMKIPFSYVNWLNSAADAGAQDVGISLCDPIVIDQATLDICATPVMAWWRSYGVNMSFAFLYVSYLIYVISRVRA